MKIEMLASDNPDVWKERGRLYSDLGQSDKAAADFRKAQRLLDGKKAEPNP